MNEFEKYSIDRKPLFTIIKTYFVSFSVFFTILYLWGDFATAFGLQSVNTMNSLLFRMVIPSLLSYIYTFISFFIDRSNSKRSEK